VAERRGADRMARGYAKAEERNRAARAALEPLAEGERPTVVTVAAVLSGLIAASIVVAYAAGIEVNGKTPELPQIVGPAGIMGIMCWGMWHARYWAVLGFQLVLVFVLFTAFFGLLVSASTAVEIAATLAVLAIAGTLFFFMVKAMARIKMPTRLPRE
jgi:hypothetical protein